MSTPAPCGARSRASRHVLITSSPCRVSATGSPTPGRANSELAERPLHEPALTDARMRDHQVPLTDPLVTKQQDVDVDDARSPAAGGQATSLLLDCFGCLEQLTRCGGPFHLDHLVQESRLVGDTPRPRLDHAALTQDARSLLTQSP